MLVDVLRDAVVAVGEDSLGLKAHQVGTHSIRSGSAMQMYLGKCPVYTIMLIGRWSSNAFLRYICKQIKQFSHNVSKRMIIFTSHCISLIWCQYVCLRWIQGSGITRTMPRREETLMATHLIRYNYQLSLSSHRKDADEGSLWRKHLFRR